MFKAAIGIAVSLIGLTTISVNATDRGGTTVATLFRILSVFEDTPMSFGIIATNSQPDTVTLSPAGDLSSVSQPYQFSGNSAPATFTTSGLAGSPVAISFSTGNRLTGPGQPMRLQNFIHDAGPTPVLDSNGLLTFNVGADLRVRNNQESGLYSGSYTITVNYQ